MCARYLPMQSALQQVFGSYDKGDSRTPVIAVNVLVAAFLVSYSYLFSNNRYVGGKR